MRRREAAGTALPVATVGRTPAEPMLMYPLALYALNDDADQTQGVVVDHTCTENGVIFVSASSVHFS